MKYLALLLVGALAFTACSKDESDVKEEKKDNIVNVDNSRPGDKNNPKPVVPKKKVLDLIAKIETYSGPRQEPIKTEIFSYDSQKRLVGISSTEPRYFTQPAMIGKGTYSTSEYVLQQEGHDSKKTITPEWKATLSLDGQGRAAKFVYESAIAAVPDRIRTPYIHLHDQFVYDKDGHLTSWFNHNRHWIVNIAWTNGNMSEIRLNDVKEHINHLDMTSSYSTLPNKTLPDLNLYLIRSFLFEHCVRFWPDQFGLRSDYLVSQMTVYFNKEPLTPENITYKLDAKGRPIEVLNVGSNNWTYKYVISYVNN